MPSNIFAMIGTNVSVIFIDKNNKGKVVLVDASKLGKKKKDGKNQKTVLSTDDEQKIINAFKTAEPIENFSVVVDYDEINEKITHYPLGNILTSRLNTSTLFQKNLRRNLPSTERNSTSFLPKARSWNKK